MIQLHQYPAVWGLSSLSPFCIKVEAYLRYQNIPYQVITERNPARGPKGKMPFIYDGVRAVADSTFILEHLRAREVTPQGIAIQRMVEEHLYFILLFSRWVDPDGFRVIQRDFASLFPFGLGKMILYLLRRRLKKQAQAQGLGRHSQKEVYDIGRKDIQALSLLLGKNHFIDGSDFSPVDATVFGFLITILKQPIPSELQLEVRRHLNLVDYAFRIERILFPEFVS